MSDPIQQPPNAMNKPENIPTRACYNCGRELTFGDTHFNPETAAYSCAANDPYWNGHTSACRGMDTENDRCECGFLEVLAYRKTATLARELATVTAERDATLKANHLQAHYIHSIRAELNASGVYKEGERCSEEMANLSGAVGFVIKQLISDRDAHKRAALELEQQLRTANFPTQQATHCGKCGVYKHTPWRDDEHGYGYVCATCLVKIYDERVAELEAGNAALKLSHKGGDEPCDKQPQSKDALNAAQTLETSTPNSVVASNAEPENVPSVSDSATLEDGK